MRVTTKHESNFMQDMRDMHNHPDLLFEYQICGPSVTSEQQNTNLRKEFSFRKHSKYESKHVCAK